MLEAVHDGKEPGRGISQGQGCRTALFMSACEPKAGVAEPALPTSELSIVSPEFVPGIRCGVLSPENRSEAQRSVLFASHQNLIKVGNSSREATCQPKPFNRSSMRRQV